VKTTETDIPKFVEQNYSIGTVLSFYKIDSGVMNKNYLLETKTNKYIFRVATHNRRNQIYNMVPFMVYASNSDYPCPKIICTKDNRNSVTLGKKTVFIMSFIDGIQGNPSILNDSKIASMAANIAKLHKLNWTTNYKAKNITLEHPFKFYEKFRALLIDSKLSGKEDYFKSMDEEFKLLKKSMPDIVTKLPSGVIHNDATQWNTLFVGDEVSSLVDFESVGIGPFLYDVARAINTSCFVDNKFNQLSANEFISAYQKKRKFSDIEKQYFPVILRYIAWRHAAYFMSLYYRTNDYPPPECMDYKCFRYYQRIGNERLLELFSFS